MVPEEVAFENFMMNFESTLNADNSRKSFEPKDRARFVAVNRRKVSVLLSGGAALKRSVIKTKMQRIPLQFLDTGQGLGRVRHL